jgi:SAM-dependent methyltransferase
MNIEKEETLKANIYVHGSLAKSGEYNKSPHFRDENQHKVRKILLNLTSNIDNLSQAKAIDFGCGTGFIIHLIRDLFSEIHGVDITDEMMKQVDLSSGNVYLHNSVAEKTPFDDNYFEFAAAYSFMDHLYSYEDFLKEAYRVLKPGGMFYSDLNPNRDFILAIANTKDVYPDISKLSPIISREYVGAVHNGSYYQENFGIESDLLDKAEPGKSVNKGFNAHEVVSVAKKIGFSTCFVEYEWFLGQAKVMHQQSIKDSEIIERYLNEILPVSSSMFKYLRFIFIK